MKIYEINETYAQLMNLDLEQEDLELALGSINTELTDKAENIGYILVNMQSDTIALDNEIKRLQAKKQALNGRIDSLKDYLANSMLLTNNLKIETPLFKFSFRKSTQLVIDDNTLVPAKYKESVVTEKIDKAAIKKDFKSGSVPGCHVEEKQNLQLK